MRTEAEIDEIVARVEEKIDAMWNNPNHKMWDTYYYQTSVLRPFGDRQDAQALRERRGREGLD